MSLATVMLLLVVKSMIVTTTATSINGDVQASSIEDDFRFISYNDLMANGAKRFTDDDVTSFDQLLFEVSRDQLFVGARDNLYRLSLRDLKLLEKALWTAPKDAVSLCQDKGQSENDCHNYVKVLLTDGRRLFACGTNAFSPHCSWRKLDEVGFVLEAVKGIAKCPYNPGANITALMTREGHYYVGSSIDFAGSNHAIYRTTGTMRNSNDILRTQPYNANWLSEPQFVGSFEDDRYVYFVFRESAVEYMNCGKKIYSRIARVCKNDSGGDVLLKNNWTTFVKARLNCSNAGQYPFYYDEIQGMQYLPEQELLYAVFTTPRNAIIGSAICVFNKSAIDETFRGPFKYQEHPGSAWESRYVPQHHTQCQKISSKSQQYADSLQYQLMDKTIQSTAPNPILSVDLELYSQIAVAVVSTKYYDTHVMFISNEDGLIKKFSVIPHTNKVCLVEIWKPQMNSLISPIKIIQYLNVTKSLYVGTYNAVFQIPASNCDRYKTQISCLGAQDPLCGWNKHLDKCVGKPNGPISHWLQELPSCPDTNAPLDGGWSAWSSWEVCLQKNENINEDVPEESQDKCLCQTRSCNNPAPRNGGKNCQGISISVTNCTVHGGWTAWSGWSSCSASCGVAVKWRRRACAAPAPQHGGRLCVGNDRTEIYCTQNPPCPAPVQPVRDGGWSEWGSWSTCSLPCGGGIRTRQRKCDSPPPDEGAHACIGCDSDTELCNKMACEVKRATSWTPWQITQSINNSDGGYNTQKRFKFSCKAQGMDQIKLSLSKEETRYCNANGTCDSMPMLKVLPTGWSAWSDWDKCNVECGGGYQSANRTCLKPPCDGKSYMQRSCNTQSCIDGWGCWGDWSSCSVSCGTGRTQRRRSCLVPGGCKGNSIQTMICEGPSCESLLGWSDWSSWSPCNSKNEESRNRQCLTKINYGDTEICQGPDTETRLCNIEILNDDIQALHGKQFIRNTPKIQEAGGFSLPIVILMIVASLSIGAVFAAIIIICINRKRAPRIPSSPHYIAKPNSYVSVPLKETTTKRVPSFSGIRNTASILTFSKPNNINTDTDSSLDTPKLYPKAMVGDYESATVKRNFHANSHNNSGCRNNVDADQDKFY